MTMRMTTTVLLSSAGMALLLSGIWIGGMLRSTASAADSGAGS
jgi:hypothetical protein